MSLQSLFNAPPETIDAVSSTTLTWTSSRREPVISEMLTVFSPEPHAPSLQVAASAGPRTIRKKARAAYMYLMIPPPLT